MLLSPGNCDRQGRYSMFLQVRGSWCTGHVFAMTAMAGASLAFGLALLLRRSPIVVLGFMTLGGAAGASYWRGRLDRAIEARRDLMRIELYTINQLLAMHIRIGSGVVSSVARITSRGRGEVIADLRDVLRLHRSGVPAAEAFRRVGAITPEPHARRTYHALAAADERGSDVARALLALSEDVRDGRRDAVRRRATKRRALMLIPFSGCSLRFSFSSLPRRSRGWSCKASGSGCEGSKPCVSIHIQKSDFNRSPSISPTRRTDSRLLRRSASPPSAYLFCLPSGGALSVLGVDLIDWIRASFGIGSGSPLPPPGG